jgi:hypothetical protein
MRTTIEDVGVDLSCLDILVPKQFLNRTNVISCLQQMSGKAVTQRVGRAWLSQAGLLRGRAHCPLDHAFVEMIAVKGTVLSLWISGQI